VASRVAQSAARKRPRNWIRYIRVSSNPTPASALSNWLAPNCLDVFLQHKPADLYFLMTCLLHANCADVVPAIVSVLGALSEECDVSNVSSVTT
jgi:hypothetical protein